MSDTETDLPVDPNAPEPDAPEQTEEQQAEEQQAEAKRTRGDVRFAALSARTAAMAAELAAERAQREALEARVAAAAGGGTSDMPVDEVRRLAMNYAQEMRAAERVEEKKAAFHEAGRRLHSDFQARCDALIEMGVDGPFSALLVEMEDGAKVASALHDDPAALERIASLKTERARAIALGKYAGEISVGAHAPPPSRVSQAPEPIRPVNGSRATFNEATATTDQLIRHYERQEAAKRAARL